MEIALIAVVCFVSIALCLINMSPGHNWGDDFALYINQAKSIVNGNVSEMIKDNLFAIQNSSAKEFSPTCAPWGFPILLTPFYLFFGQSILAFKLAEILFFCVFLIIFFKILLNKFPLLIAILLTSAISVNYYYINHTNVVLSEIPFLLFSLWALLLIEKYKLIGPYKNVIILSVVLFFSFLIRSEGFALYIALAAWQARELFTFKKEKQIINCKIAFRLALPYLIAICLYLLVSTILPMGFTSHLNYSFSISWQSIQKTLFFYKDSLGILSGNSADILNWILISFFLIGFFKRAIQDIHLATYLVVFLAIFFIWPFHNLRYLLAIFPIAFYFIIQGIFGLVIFRNNLLPAVGLLCLLIMSSSFVTTAQIIKKDYDHVMSQGPDSYESQRMFDYVKSHTKKDDVIIFFRPRAMNLYTGRRSAMIYDNWKNIRSKGDYLIIHKQKGDFYQMNSEKFRDPYNPELKSFIKIGESKDFLIYKTLK